MGRWFVLFGLFCLPLFAQEEFEKLHEKMKDVTDVSERALQAGEYFLGRPFDPNGPLGEGTDGKYDNDPLIRADAFDCTTYVEAVSALALAKSYSDFMDRAKRIRYLVGEVSFTKRNHFPEADWIPNNIREGFFEDITKEIAGESLQVARTTIKKKAWYAKMEQKQIKGPGTVEELREETKDIADEVVTLDYIPFTAVLSFSEADLAQRKTDEAAIREKYKDDKPKLKVEIAKYRKDFLRARPEAVNWDLLKKIPSGVVVNYTHPDRPLEPFIGTNMIVTHQGFFVWKEGKPYARHAAINDRVVDVPFIEYIDLFTMAGKLDPRGFHLLKLRQP